MGVPDWSREEQWDTVFLAGTPMPGIARVDAQIPSAIDKRKSKGAKKSRPVDVGEHSIEFVIELELLPEHMDAFEAALRRIRFVAGSQSREPVAIYHPQAALLGVAHVMIGEIELPHPETGGTMVATIQAVEWRKPLKQAPAKKKPVGTPNDFGNTQDVQDLIDENSPARAPGAAEQNFSSDPSLYQNESVPIEEDLFTPG